MPPPITNAHVLVHRSWKKNTYIPFGLAFWPGGVLENWTDINPCDPQKRDQLTQAKVKVAVYNMKVRTRENSDAVSMRPFHRSTNKAGHVADQRSHLLRCPFRSTVSTMENISDLITGNPRGTLCNPRTSVLMPLSRLREPRG